MPHDIRDTITRLLKYADPEGEVHARLVKIADQVDRGLMIGPKSRRLLATLTEMVDNVECRYLMRDGLCPKAHGECQFTGGFAKCHMYEAPIPPKRGTDPLAPGGN